MVCAKYAPHKALLDKNDIIVINNHHISVCFHIYGAK